MPTAPLPWGRFLLLALVLLTAPIYTLRLSAQVRAAAADTITRFLENRGQVVDMEGAARPDILFTAGAPGLRLYLRRTGISYVFYTIEYDTTLPSSPFPPSAMTIPKERLPFMKSGGDPSQAVLHGRRIDMELIGANPNAAIERAGPSSDRVNFYLPQCPDGITDLAKYATVTYRDIYPSIDLVLHGTASGMKYDFVVHPGGDVAQIRLRYTGAEGLKETSDGGVQISSTLGNLVEGRPYSYQTAADRGSSGEKRVEVVSGYRLRGEEITFQMGEYDHARRLVIDPMLIWGTYYGGTAFDYSFGWVLRGGGGWGDLNQGMAVDINGNISIDGGTFSTDFPVTVGAFQVNLANSIDAVILSFNPNGTRRWSTYFGGSSWDYANGIGVDSVGSVSAAVLTASSNCPVTSDERNGTSVGRYDIVVARFDQSGRRRWSTFYGTASNDYVGELAVDRWGNIGVSGYTEALDFPVTVGAFQTTSGGGSDAFLMKLDSNGGVLWTTYIGGSGYDWGGQVAFDSSGNVAFSGATHSPNFPVTAGAFQTTLRSGNANTADMFVMSFDAVGRRNWGTYIGGTNNEWSSGVGFDRAGNVYVGGTSSSPDFPVTPRAIQPTLGAPNATNLVFSKFTPAGRLVWSTYYGGTIYEGGSGISVAPNGHLFFICITSGGQVLKTTNNFQSTFQGIYDAVIGEFDSSGAIIWDTYYGGTGQDWGNGISGDGVGSVYISGFTSSPDMPTRRAIQLKLNRNAANGNNDIDMFIARFCDSLYPNAVAIGTTTLCDGDSVTIQGPAGYDKYRWTSTTDTTQSITVGKAGIYSVYVEDVAGCNGQSSGLQVVVNPLPKPKINAAGPTTVCEGDTVILRIRYTGARRFLWTTGETSDSIIVTQAGTYSVRVTDTNGCAASSPVELVVVNALPTRPVIKPSDTIWICLDSTTFIDIGSFYYRTEWNNGKTTPTIRVGEGRYWARVTNQQGCAAWSDTVVVLPRSRNRPTINPLGSIFVCPGDTVMLDAGSGYTEYRWSTGDSTRFGVGRLAGPVTVTVTDTNGCRLISDPITISYYAIEPALIKPSGSSTICEGDSLVLDAGTGKYAGYRWSTGDTSAVITVRTAGDYSVSVTPFGGCIGSADTITVIVNPAPDATITGPASVCIGSTQVYAVPSISGAQYLWTIGGDGAAQGSVTANSVVVTWGTTGPGRVSVRVIDPTTGCASSRTMSVTLGRELVPNVSALSLMVCPGDSLELDAGGGYDTYLWNTGATTRRILVAAAGTYYVQVANNGGCSGRSDDVVIGLYPATTPIIRALGPTRFDAGDSVVLEVVGGYATYRWMNGATTQRIVARVRGNYSVTVTDSNGCRGTSGSLRVSVVPAGGYDTVIARVEVGSLAGEPGDRVMVPIRMEAPDLDTSIVTGFVGELRYNRTILLPTGTTPQGSIDGSDHVINFSGSLPSGISTGGDLTRLEFIVLLGNAETTPLRLTSFELIGAPVAATITDGEFRLTGLCRNGGTRLANSDGSFGLKSVRPNPTNGICEVEYEIVESGMTRVYVVDLLGRRVAELQSGAIDPGRYVVVFNSGSVGSGIYSIILETPTQRRSGLLQVVR